MSSPEAAGRVGTAEHGKVATVATPQPPPPTLAYHPAPRRIWRLSLLQFAFCCGAGSLAFGLATFIAWLLSGWKIWFAVGTLAICGGTMAVVGGAVAVGVYVWRAAQTGEPPWRDAMRRAVLTGAVLLSPFPVAAVCVVIVNRVESTYVVSVANATAQPVESVFISGPGFSRDLGPIAAGGVAHCVCNLRGEGSLTFAVSQGGVPAAGTIAGYVETNFGGDDLLTISAPGVVRSTGQTRSPLRKWLDMR